MELRSGNCWGLEKFLALPFDGKGKTLFCGQKVLAFITEVK
jgi:hypothetical protein